TGHLPPPGETLTVHPRRAFGFGLIVRAMFGRYRRRAFLAFVLMVSQAFLYNALFFTYALVLTHFYGVAEAQAGLYLLPLAASNFLGPLLLGRWFDTRGRRVMIAGSYLVSAVLLAAAGLLFAADALDAATQTLAWAAIFFYAIGTAAGGIAAPVLFGSLIGIGSRWYICEGYLAAAALMLFAAIVEAVFGVDAENRSLESVAAPLSS